MRLDKYLKVSRIIKRRTLAKEICDQGKIKINGRVAKASSEVQIGNQLELDFGSKILIVEIKGTPNSVSAALAKETYEIVREVKVEAL